MSIKTIAYLLALGLIAAWVITSPSGAAHVVHNIGTFLSSAASGIMQFFDRI